MISKLIPIAIAAVLILSVSLAGCQAGGIPQSQYDQANARLAEAQAQLAEAQNQLNQLQAEKGALAGQLEGAAKEITALQGQLKDLEENSSLAGATPAETAEKIVRYYHETHVYSTYDLFICSDMAAEVWNMLKAQGINAVVAVGDIEKEISDVVLCNHAWVLAEVAPGQYLALETTGGYAVPAAQNALYYRGWSFDTPASLKSYNQMIREYNVRVGIRNEIAAADRAVIEEYNKSTSQAQADKLEAVHNELIELIEQQESVLNSLMAEISDLARPIS